MIASICHWVAKVFFDLFRIVVCDEDMVGTTSHNEHKFSYHLVVWTHECIFESLSPCNVFAKMIAYTVSKVGEDSDRSLIVTKSRKTKDREEL